MRYKKRRAKQHANLGQNALRNDNLGHNARRNDNLGQNTLRNDNHNIQIQTQTSTGQEHINQGQHDVPQWTSVNPTRINEARREGQNIRRYNEIPGRDYNIQRINTYEELPQVHHNQGFEDVNVSDSMHDPVYQDYTPQAGRYQKRIKPAVQTKTAHYDKTNDKPALPARTNYNQKRVTKPSDMDDPVYQDIRVKKTFI